MQIYMEDCSNSCPERKKEREREADEQSREIESPYQLLHSRDPIPNPFVWGLCCDLSSYAYAISLHISVCSVHCVHT